jgi:nitroreductase
MDYDSLLELVKSRRSHRLFKPEPIPDGYIDKIIEVARWSPSGFNMQPWEFVVVKKQELRNRIVELVNEYRRMSAMMEETREPWQRSWKVQESHPDSEEMDYSVAPVYIILYGDTRTNVGLPMAVRYDHHRRPLIFNVGLASAFIYMHLAATTLGLATQWMSATQVPFIQCMLKDLLGIPRHMEVFDTMILGYPLVKQRSKFMRSTDKMVHYDYCGEDDFRTEDEVNDYIRRGRTWTMAMHDRRVKTK